MKAEKCHYSYIRYVLSYTAHKWRSKYANKM